jgi:hypothetical protein
MASHQPQCQASKLNFHEVLSFIFHPQKISLKNKKGSPAKGGLPFSTH